MTQLNKGLLIVAASAVVVMGCNDEDGGGELAISNVTLKSPSYVISGADSLEMAMVLDIASDSFSATMSDSDFRSTQNNTRSINPRALSSRISERSSLECETGSGSVNASSNDIDELTQEMSVDGTITMDITFNNCFESYYDYDYSLGYFDLLLNGSTQVELKWQGYDANSGEFDTVFFSLKFNDYTSTKIYQSDDSTEVTLVDGIVKTKVTSDKQTMAWALSLAGPETNGLIVTTRTTENLTFSTTDQAISGAWEVKGANGTKAEVTVVANGFEVSINGGQAELISWSEL